MQLILVPGIRPRFRAHPLDRLRVEPAQVRGLLHRQVAARLDRQRAPLLGRGIVQEGVRLGAQDLLGQGRRAGQFAARHLHFAGLDAAQQPGQPIHVHDAAQAVLQGLRNQRMVRDLALAREVFRAGKLIGEHRGQQVFGIRPLEEGRRPLAVAEAPHRQRDAGVPAPAAREDGRVEHGLGEHVRNRGPRQVAAHFVQREAVHDAQRDDDGVFQRRRLQLEVEPPAEAFPERQAPGAVEPRAVGRMHHDVGVARLVEEALDDDAFRRGQTVQRGAGRAQVFGQLLRRGGRQTALRREPSGHAGNGLMLQRRVHFRAQARHRRREFIAAPRGLAEPERNGRRQSAGILDEDLAGVHLEDSIGGVAELEDVARHALEGEVLVQRADKEFAGQQHDVEVELVGNRAAVGHRRQAGRPPGPQPPVDPVVVQVGAAAAALGGEAVGEHLENVQVGAAGKAAERRASGDEPVQRIDLPLPHAHLGDDLLAQHVQRFAAQRDGVQFPLGDGVQQRRAFHQFVARQRHQPPLRHPVHAVAGPPHPLQQPRDAPGRAKLADQVHLADVDAQFQRRRGHQHLEFSGLEPLLGHQPVLFRQAAVVGGDPILAAPVRQVPGHAFGQPAGVDEHDRGAVTGRERGQPVVDLDPDLVGHDRLQRRRRQFQPEVPVADVALVDDLAGPAVRAGEKLHHGLHGPGGGRDTHPHGRPPAQRRQPLQGDRQVGAALVARQRVDLVHDDRLHRPQHAASGLGGQQDVQRLRRGDQDVGRPPAHLRPLALGGVAGANQGADADIGQARLQQFIANTGQRRLQVLVDVVGQRLERRHVENAGLVRQRGVKPPLDQRVDDGEEGSERLARSRRGADQRMGTRADRPPRAALDLGRARKLTAEPTRDRWMEAVRIHEASIRETASAFLANCRAVFRSGAAWRGCGRATATMGGAEISPRRRGHASIRIPAVPRWFGPRRIIAPTPAVWTSA